MLHTPHDAVHLASRPIPPSCLGLTRAPISQQPCEHLTSRWLCAQCRVLISQTIARTIAKSISVNSTHQPQIKFVESVSSNLQRLYIVLDLFMWRRSTPRSYDQSHARVVPNGTQEGVCTLTVSWASRLACTAGQCSAESRLGSTRSCHASRLRQRWEPRAYGAPQNQHHTAVPHPLQPTPHAAERRPPCP